VDDKLAAASDIGFEPLDGACENAEALVVARGAEEAEADGPAGLGGVPGAHVVEGAAACAAVDLVEVRLAEADVAESRAIDAHALVDAAHELAGRDDERGVVERIDAGEAAPAVRAAVEDAEVEVARGEEAFVGVEGGASEFVDLVAVADLQAVVEGAGVVGRAGVEAAGRVGVGLDAVGLLDVLGGGLAFALEGVACGLEDDLHECGGLGSEEALRALLDGAVEADGARGTGFEAADAAAAAVVVHAAVAFLVQQVDLGADVPVVVGRDDDGPARAPDGPDDAEGEALERVDVDDLRADRVEPADHEGVVAGAGELVGDVGEVGRGGREVPAVDERTAAHAAPGLLVADTRTADEGVVHAGTQVEDAVAGHGESRGEFRRGQVVAGAFEGLESESRPAEDGDAQGAVGARPALRRSLRARTVRIGVWHGVARRRGQP